MTTTSRSRPGARTWTNRHDFRTSYIEELIKHGLVKRGECVLPLSKPHLVDCHNLGFESVSTLRRYLGWWGDGLPDWHHLVYGFTHARKQTVEMLRTVLDHVVAESAPAAMDLLQPVDDAQRAVTELDDALLG